MAAGELGEHAARLDEEDRVAPPAGGVPERRGDMGLADADGPVEDDRLTALEEAQRGEVADQRRRQDGL